MKRLFLALSLLAMGGVAYAGNGGFSGLVVSSGTYSTVSTYANDDGGNRQAIVLGARLSSATLTVDPVTGIPVYLSTGSTNGVITNGVGTVNIVSTGTINTAQQGNITLNALPTGTNSIGSVTTNGIGTVNVVSTNTLNTSQQGNITVNALPTGTNSIGSVTTNGVGTVNIISTNTLNVAQQGNITLNALPAGSNSIGNVNIVSTNTLNVAQQGNITLNALPAGSNTIGAITTTPAIFTGTVTPGTGTWSVGGNVAGGATDSGNPVKIGGIGHTTYQTAVTDAQRVDAAFDSEGKQLMMPYAVPALSTSGITAAMTGTSDTVLISSGGANILTYIDQILCTNSHATVGTVINIKNGFTTFYTGYAVAAGGGFSVSLPTPLRGAANTQWVAVNATTGSNTYCSVSGYFAKN